MSWDLVGSTTLGGSSDLWILLHAADALTRYKSRLIWELRKPYVIRMLAFEIESEAQAYLDFERAFDDEWPWETDVLNRMDIDETARVRRI